MTSESSSKALSILQRLRYACGTYCILAIVITWGFWLNAATLAPPGGVMNEFDTTTLILHSLGGIGPICAAFVVEKWYNLPNPFVSVRIIKDNPKGVPSVAPPPMLCLVAFTTPATVSAISNFMYAYLVSPFYENESEISYASLSQVFNLPSFLSYSILTFLIIWLEERGWRSFLFPTLLKTGIGFSWSCILTGLVWSVWHVPIFLYALPHKTDNPIHFAWYACALIVQSIIMGYTSKFSSHSLLCACLGHAGFNGAIGAFTSLAENGLNHYFAVWSIIAFVSIPIHIALLDRVQHEKEV